MSLALLLLAFVFYAIALHAFWQRVPADNATDVMRAPQGSPALQGLPAPQGFLASLQLSMTAGVVLHLIGLYLLERFDVFASLSWVAALMALATSIIFIGKREYFLPALACAIACLTLLIVSLLPAPPVVRAIRGWQIQLHLGIALLAYAVLSIACVQALLVWIAEKTLRDTAGASALTRIWRRWSAVMPPLSRLERQLFQLIGLGFALLTLTLLSGALFVTDWFAQHLVHKTVLTLVSWLVFAAVLLAHKVYGLRGRQAAWITLIGMVLLLLAFFGSKVVLELILKR
jgi:ABC-type uncharacterized transport system permease subunit